MTTLTGNELFDYLAHLEDEIDKRISTSNKESLQYLMHSQMKEIINSEEDFLKYINSNGTPPVLSISPNGLPSVASLNPDLEKICELAEEENSFKNIAQKFRKGVNGKNRGEEGHLYSPVSEEEWNKELTNRSKEKLQSQSGFAVSETEDGKFQLSLREDIYLQGYDKHSKEFPVLIREGRMGYHVVWNRLIEDSEESFYAPDTALVLQGQPTKQLTKHFDDITRFYSFNNSDFGRFRKLWFIRLPKGGTPNNYSTFLAAGTNTRVRTTGNILEAMGKALEREVIIKGIGKHDMDQVLAFATITSKNAPEAIIGIPRREDLYDESKESINGSPPKYRFPPKYPMKFDLIFAGGGYKAGEIEYILPHNQKLHGYYGSYTEFTKGGIKLTVLGNCIWNEKQYRSLQRELKKVKKR